MKTKAAKSSWPNVRPLAGQIKRAVTKWFLRNSVIAARLYEQSQRKKGWFFAMKARMVKFYEHNVEAKLKTARTRSTRFKQGVTGRLAAVRAKLRAIKQQGRTWLVRHRRSLWVTAIVAIAMVAIATLVYGWQRSPAFRATVKPVTVVVLSITLTLWALLKGLGLSLSAGLMGLGRGLISLGTGIPTTLTRWWSRLTQPIGKVVVVPPSAPDSIPVSPLDGRLL